MYTYSNNSLFNHVEYTYDENAQTITVEYHAIGEPVHRRYETETLFEVLQARPFYLDAAAARFVCEWYPELIGYVREKLQYCPFDWLTFAQMDENELAEFLAWNDTTENGYNEKYGLIIRDAAFDGAIVVGE